MVCQNLRNTSGALAQHGGPVKALLQRVDLEMDCLVMQQMKRNVSAWLTRDGKSRDQIE